MSLPKIVEIAKADLYTNKEELAEKYAQSHVEHLLRLRDMVTWSIANPDAKDRQFVDEERTRYEAADKIAVYRVKSSFSSLF